VLALTVVLSAAGCGSPASDPVRVVAATAVTASQPAPAVGPAGLAAVRRAAESDRGEFTLVVAGAPADGVTFPIVALRGDRVEHGPRRDVELAAHVDRAIAAVGSAAPATGAPDLLGALAEAARGTPGTLLVADSGVTIADPVDLRRLGWEADPAAVVADLRARDALPDLTGWDVLFSGLGRVAAGQKAPGIPQQHWLERFWLALCAGSGARSCALDPLTGPPTTVAPATRTAPVVPVPENRTVVSSDGVVEVTLPDSRLGFAPGSAALADGADEALEPIVARYREGRYRIGVEGFVAFWGDEGYRATLSSARAEAVSRRLVELGVSPSDITSAGRGAADGPEASTTAGEFDEQKVVANGLRRVVVRLDASQGA